MEIALLVVGLIVGGFMGYLIAKSRSTGASVENHPLVVDLKGRLQKKEEEALGVQKEKESIIAQLASAKESVHRLEIELKDQKQELLALQEQFKKEFENIANKILDEKSKKFTSQNQENLDAILKPLKERIKEFEQKVEKTYYQGGKERESLKKELEQLMALNQQLSKDANNLVSALKGESKVQGDWGEYQLEMILEKAGLEKGVHFSTQSTFRDGDGNLKKPDFIIHLPEEKKLIIDSKVSLSAYEQFSSAPEEEKAAFLKGHIESIRNHIRDLGKKNYQQLYDINTPDYVLMYIPIEPAFNVAAVHDERLFSEALDKNIVIVTTSTLLATMKTVSFIWKQEYQKRNVLEIARQGAALYDKFVGFTDSLIKVGKQLDTVKGTYSEAMKQLSEGRGNLVKRAQDMKNLGLETGKSLDGALVERASQNTELQ